MATSQDLGSSSQTSYYPGGNPSSPGADTDYARQLAALRAQQTREDQLRTESEQYAKQTGDTAYARTQASPANQMGAYQVRQARRSPEQKGTDLGTTLSALQKSTGLNLLGSGSASGGGYGGVTAGNQVTMGGGGAPGGPSSTLAPVDTSAAQAAQFGRAKDQVGQETSGALAGLRSSLGGRGMLGSGAESRGTSGIINAGQQQLGDTSRQAAITGSDLANQNATTNYQGGITQRGQDIGASEAAFQGGITQRGQDLAASEAAAARQQQVLQGLLSALGGGGGLY